MPALPKRRDCTTIRRRGRDNQADQSRDGKGEVIFTVDSGEEKVRSLQAKITKRVNLEASTRTHRTTAISLMGMDATATKEEVQMAVCNGLNSGKLEDRTMMVELPRCAVMQLLLTSRFKPAR